MNVLPHPFSCCMLLQGRYYDILHATLHIVTVHNCCAHTQLKARLAAGERQAAKRRQQVLVQEQVEGEEEGAGAGQFVFQLRACVLRCWMGVVTVEGAGAGPFHLALRACRNEFWSGRMAVPL